MRQPCWLNSVVGRWLDVRSSLVHSGWRAGYHGPIAPSCVFHRAVLFDAVCAQRCRSLTNGKLDGVVEPHLFPCAIDPGLRKGLS